MVAAFGSGAMFSLVSGMGGPNQAANAVTSGLFFALVQGGLFKVCINSTYFIIAKLADSSPFVLIILKHFKRSSVLKVFGYSFVLSHM